MNPNPFDTLKNLTVPLFILISFKIKAANLSNIFGITQIK
jgi:hypothetical protein